MLPEQKEVLWVLSVRFDQVGVVIGAAAVFVFTTGIRPLTGEEEIVPFKGALGIAAALAEVFNMLPVLIEVAFAIGTATALHGVEVRSDLSPFLVGRGCLGPLVLAVVVVRQANGGMSSVKKMHGSGWVGWGRKFGLELRQADHPVAIKHEVMARTKVGIECYP